jgi:hypothetical protein
VDELAKRIRVSTWYSLPHVTGPSAVLVTLCFGQTPANGRPRVERTLRDGASGDVKFDLVRYVDEVLEGVAEANAAQNATIAVEAIRVVTDDYPSSWQVKYAAYRLALRAIEDSRR